MLAGKYKWLDDESAQEAQGGQQGKYRWLDDDDGSSGGGEKPSWIESFLSGAGDAASFGFGDELLGAVGGVGGLWSGEGYDEARRRITDWSRGQQGLAQQADPWAYGGGQLAGSIGSGFGIGGVARAGLQGAGMAANAARAASKAGPLTRILTAAGTGAIGGGAYGAGSANNENDMLGAAIEGAAWGAPLGGGLRGLGEIAGHVGRNVIKPTFSAQERAAKAIAKGMTRHGQDDAGLLKAIDEAPDNATVMDVIAGGPQVVMGAGARPSAGKEAFRDLLDERNNAMADEAATDLWETTLGKKYRIDAGRRMLDIKQAKEAFDYSDVDAQTVKPGDTIKQFILGNIAGGKFKSAIDDVIDDFTPDVMRAAGKAVNVEELMKQPKFLRRVWENVRSDLDEQVKNARKGPIGDTQGSGLNTMKRNAARFRSALGKTLGKEWEDKQAAFKALAEEEANLKFGYTALSAAGDIKLGAFLNRFNKLNDQQKTWVRQGALAAIEDTMNKADTMTGRADVLRSIIGNKSKIVTLNHILGRVTKDGGVDRRYGLSKVLDRLEKQRELFQNSVKSGIGVNSHTADKLLANEALVANTNPTAGGLMGALWKVVTRESKDEYDEAVANEVLRLMALPPKQIRDQIDAAGGLKKWLDQKNLLARAMKLQQQMAGGFRAKELPNAALTGLYSNVGFADPAAGVLGL